MIRTCNSNGGMCYTFELWEEVLWRACNDEGNAKAAHHVQENKRDDDDKHDENQRCKHIVGSLHIFVSKRRSK